MKLALSKKKLAVFISIGIAVCVGTATILMLLFKKPVATPEESHPTNISIQNPENAIADPITPEPKEEEPAPEPEPEPQEAESPTNQYYIEVNRQQNVVMVYALSQNNKRLVKTFVASTGRPDSETIVGTFYISGRYEALYLVGDVWGRYAVRIDGPYFFHSVPYFSKGDSDWDDLEYLEYNKLGSPASAGCVRLAVRDARWIYENIPDGTEVKIYDADTLPEGVIKPTSIEIEESSPNRGWDPTDSSPDNPWWNNY